MKKFFLLTLSACLLLAASPANAVDYFSHTGTNNNGDTMIYNLYDSDDANYYPWAYNEVGNHERYTHFLVDNIWLDYYGASMFDVLDNPLNYSSSARDAFSAVNASLAGKVDQTTTVAGHALTSNITLNSSDIADTSSVGRSVMMASGQAAARTALGAGTSSFDGTWTSLTGKPSFATVATSGAYNDLSGKPSLATVATSGAYADLSGKPSVPTAFNYGTPNTRTLSLNTAYQCTDNTKPCLFTVTVSCPITASILGAVTCSGEIRIGSANTVAGGSTGTIVGPISTTVGGLLSLQNTAYETKTIALPTGWYLAVRQPTSPTGGAGTLTVPAAFDQSAQ